MRSLSLTFLLFIASLGQAQNEDFNWLIPLGDSSTRESIHAIECDQEGNTFVLAKFNGNMLVDPNHPLAEWGFGEEINSNSGSDDIFIAKYNPFGELVWVNKIGGPQHDWGKDLHVDSEGAVIISLQFLGTINLNSLGIDGSVTCNLCSPNGPDYFNYGEDALVMKFSSEGQLMWTLPIHGETAGSEIFPGGISSDVNNNLIFAFSTESQAVVGPLMSTDSIYQDSLVLAHGGGVDGVILKLTSQGLVDSFLHLDSPQNESCTHLQIRDSVIYVSGSFNDSTNFTPLAGAPSYLSTELSSNYIGKFHTETLEFQGGFNVKATNYRVDDSENFYLISGYSGTVDVDLGPGIDTTIGYGLNDFYIQKLSPSGTHLWMNCYGGTSQDAARGFRLDKDYNPCVCGSFRQTIDFDPEGLGFELVSSGGDEGFVFSLDSNGTLQWANRLGSIGTDICQRVAFDAANRMLLGGFYSDSVDFDPSVEEHVSGTVADWDGFVVNWSSCSTLSMNMDITSNDSSVCASPFIGEVLWVDCENPETILGVNTPCLYPSEDGYYGYNLDVNGCTMTSDCIYIEVEEPTNTIEHELPDSKMTIFPNPCSGQLNLNFNENMHEFIVNIYSSVSGRALKTYNSQNSLDVSDLSSGVYILEFLGPDHRELTQFIKL